MVRSDNGAGPPLAFRLRDVTVRYDASRAALDGLDLDIAAGEQVALIGPSGAGKTTLLRLLNATVAPTRGEVFAGDIRLDTVPQKTLKLLRCAIGFVHQDLALIPNVRVLRNVLAGSLGRQSFASSIRSMVVPNDDELARVHRILERVGVGDKLYQRTDTLSGGQRQRVAIARALYQTPRALLADEPVSSVDPARARDTVELLTSLAAERGVTLVMSLHNVDLAREYFPRVVGLRGGRVVVDGAPSDLEPGQLSSLFELEDSEMLRDGA